MFWVAGPTHLPAPVELPVSFKNRDMDSANLSEAAQIRMGVELFNRGEFFECHEVLEQVWLNAQQQKTLFLQGLIQIAVSFYHLRRGNTIGAERLLSAGVSKLKANDVGPRWIDS